MLLHACQNGQSEKNNPILADTSGLQKAEPDASIPGSFTEPGNLKFDSSRIADFMDSFPDLKPVKKDMESFYRGRDFAFAWFDHDGLIEPAENLFNRMLNLHAEGLPGQVSYKDQWIGMMEEAHELANPSPAIDLMLTAQYFRYAKIAWQGMSESKSRSLEWFLPRKQVPLTVMLDSLVSGKTTLQKAPVYRQYELLKQYLGKYDEIRDNGGWPVIAAPKKSYKTGDSLEAIKNIRSHLFITGDIPANNGSAVFDDELLLGVKSYQKRMGLTEDGIVGKSMIAEMNIPVDKRIGQIMVNMERCRWVPAGIQRDYLVVNIPEFRLHLYEQDSLLWSMKVVVGKAQHKTVIFNGNIRYIVFSPYWNVPNSILKNEILPAIRRNPNYLARHNMEWYDGRVRQKPGPNNSLGLVKFLFPNSHSIYLHDTPAKSLFNESNRAFSHGCIRLENAKKLAEYLLRNDSSWTPQNIQAAMEAGKERTITLKKECPVFIAYFTSWVDREGKLNFRKDIYQRDGRLLKMILDERQ